MSVESLLVLLGWGMLVGVDLVSVPQMMIARPLVAGTVAGAILGDIETGLKLGVVFELLQYDILPVGAVRYPEYGPATVAAVATAHATAGALGLGLLLLARDFKGLGPMTRLALVLALLMFVCFLSMDRPTRFAFSTAAMFFAASAIVDSNVRTLLAELTNDVNRPA